MINREQVEKILTINGVHAGSPDEQIRSVLLSARYSMDEVDTAIMVLREDTKTKKTRVDGLHKVFRSGEGLNPTEISQLLGIDVTIEDKLEERKRAQQMTFVQYLMIWVMSVVLAVSGILFFMYIHKVGPFFPSAQLTSTSK